VGDRDDIKTALELSSGEPVRGTIFVLRVNEGPDAGASRVLDGVDEARVLIGQSAVCTLRLTDPTVSRRHAALRREEHAWRLLDLGSTNGTRVNGVRVKEAFLTGGELVSVGATTLKLTRAGAAPATALGGSSRFGRFVGGSEIVRQRHAAWASLAAADIPILIEGETGTGKEVLAESLHDAGERAGRPFIILDCAAIPREQHEGAIHGVERAGAIQPGVFEQADGGTLVIDEPSELDLAIQAQLAACLERREVVRLGSGRRVPFDVRVIATSRRDLDHEIQAGRFREDLLHRLAGATIELPPLRERVGDATLLAQHFWALLGGAGQPPPELLARFEDAAWPGNVRELVNTLAERLAVGSEAAQAASAAKPEAAPPRADASFARVLAMDLPFVRARQEILREFERRFVERVLEQHGGNVSRAAAASGLARRYFQILK
jgi:two-component system, NtrC family, response regulator HydG